MFRAQADRVEAAFESGEWVLPDQLVGRTREPPQELRAERILPLNALIKEIRGVFSGLSEEEIVQLARDLGVEEEEIQAYLQTNNIENLVQAGYEAAVQRIGADTTFDPTDADVQAIQARLNEQARGIAGTTQEEVNRAIREGIAENESVSEVQGRVTSTLRRMADGTEEVDQSRARRIASTTTTTAFEKGQEKAMRENGMFGRMWLSQRDVHVRRGHLEADGQTVELDRRAFAGLWG